MAERVWKLALLDGDWYAIDSEAMEARRFDEKVGAWVDFEFLEAYAEAGLVPESEAKEIWPELPPIGN